MHRNPVCPPESGFFRIFFRPKPGLFHVDSGNLNFIKICWELAEEIANRHTLHTGVLKLHTCIFLIYFRYLKSYFGNQIWKFMCRYFDKFFKNWQILTKARKFFSLRSTKTIKHQSTTEPNLLSILKVQNILIKMKYLHFSSLIGKKISYLFENPIFLYFGFFSN